MTRLLDACLSVRMISHVTTDGQLNADVHMRTQRHDAHVLFPIEEEKVWNGKSLPPFSKMIFRGLCRTIYQGQLESF